MVMCRRVRTLLWLPALISASLISLPPPSFAALGIRDGGPTVACVLRHPSGPFADTTGRVFIAGTGHHRVRMVGTDGDITTAVGSGLMFDGSR